MHPLPVGDIVGRRKRIEAVHARADVAQLIPAGIETADYQVNSADGTSILLRWYTTDRVARGPAVVFCHGSGMILSSIDLYHGTVCRYVSASNVPFLSVEYRLAPEFPHPKPVEDGYAALCWLAQHAVELGVDPGRIAVMGDSGGGGVAAGVALIARDRNGPAISRQLLIYPMLDDRTTTPDPALSPFVVWSYEDNLTAWRALLGDACGGPDVSPYAAPARILDASGMPPLYMEVMELDIFRDEDIDYARSMISAAVSTELHLYRAVPHAFETIAFNTAAARRVMTHRIEALRSL